METLKVDGIINESLSRGLRKRMEREASKQREADLSRLTSRRTKSKKRWMRDAKNSLKAMAGEYLISMSETNKNVYGAYLLSESIDRCYYVMGTKLNGRKCKSSHHALPVAYSEHAIERYFQRIGRPFSFSDLVDIARGMVTIINEESDEEGYVDFSKEEKLQCLEDGMMVYELVDKEHNDNENIDFGIYLAKTFYGKKELSGKRLLYWEEEMAKKGKDNE